MYSVFKVQLNNTILLCIIQFRLELPISTWYYETSLNFASSGPLFFMFVSNDNSTFILKIFHCFLVFDGISLDEL